MSLQVSDHIDTPVMQILLCRIFKYIKQRIVQILLSKTALSSQYYCIMCSMSEQTENFFK